MHHIASACRALSLPRSTWYRLRHQSDTSDPDTLLRDQIQRIALDRPTYGYRRITAQLKREGQKVNSKRVRRLMGEDNLLCLRWKSFLITTDSKHHLPIYPNLTANLNINKLDQLWVADITYIRLQREFVYLAILLDAYSRRLIGWALGCRLHADLCVAALKIALERRSVNPDLVHHSDRKGYRGGSC